MREELGRSQPERSGHRELQGFGSLQAGDKKVALKSFLFPLPQRRTPRDPAATPLGGGTAASPQRGSAGACRRWRAARNPRDPRWNLPARWRAQSSELGWGS